MQEAISFSKWKGPSPEAALGPDYEKEITKSHILPPLESYSLKPLGKDWVSSHSNGLASRVEYRF